jgi:hypothetical protein
VSQELTPEDHALLAALAALEPEPEPAGPRAVPAAIPVSGSAGEPADSAGNPDHEVTETLVRLNREVLGLLPGALVPVTPRPQVKRRLMAAIAAAPAGTPAPAAPRAGEPLLFPRRAAAPAVEGSAASAEGLPHRLPAGDLPDTPAAGAAPAVGTSAVEHADHAERPAAAQPADLAVTPSPAPADGAGASPSGAPAVTTAEAVIVAPAAGAVQRRRRQAGRPGWLGLAAALIVMLIGTSGWLLRGALEQGATIARLRAQRDAALRQAGDLEARLRRLAAEAGNLRQDFAIATSPAVEACALQPTAPAGPEVGGAHGVLFVAADHQHWAMSLRGLRPAAAGKVYQLWFLSDSGPVSAGTFDAAAGAPWELAADHMPAGTREVRVTLEDGTGSTAPHGPEMLRSAGAFRVL